MDKLLKVLKKVKNKIFAEKVLNLLLFSLSIGFLACGGLFFAGKFVYIPNINDYFYGLIALAFLGGIVLSLIKRPSISEAARACDGLGFKERFSTSYELSKSGKANSQLVINDALRQIENNDIVKMYKISVDKKRAIGFLMAFALMAVSGLTPVIAYENIENKKELSEEIAKRIDVVEKETKELLTYADSKQAQEIEKIAEELKKNIKSSENQTDIMEAAKKAQEKMVELSKDNSNKDLAELGGALKKHESTKALGEAIESGDFDQINKEMEELLEFLKNATEEEIAEFIEALNEAAKEISQNNELGQSLNQLNEAISSGSMSQIQDSVSKVNEALNSMSGSNQELRDAIDNYNKAISGSSNQSGNQNSGENSGENSSQGQSGEGQNGQDGQGQDGQGQGQGQGQGGQGQGGQGGNQGSGGQGQGKGHIENEDQYSREAIYMKDSEFGLNSDVTDGGENIKQEIKRIGEAGESVPYDKVLGEYKNDALNSLSDSQIPHGLKEMVKEYFTSLE